MKLSFSLKFLTFAIIGMLFFTSCTDETTEGAVVSFETGAGYLTGDAEVVPGGTFTVNLKALKGDNEMKTLTINEESSKVELSRIEIDGSPAFANPILLSGANTSSFNYVITIDAGTVQGTKSYSFAVTDTEGTITTKSLKITVAGTLVTTLTGVLFNQSGPVGFGGLNLLTGEGTGTSVSDVNSQIRDMGIDSSSTVTGTWKQKVGSLNGSVLRYIKKGQNGVAENFTFADIITKEQLVTLWDKGGATFSISEKIVVGDFLMVLHKNTYFLIEVKEINVTTTDNKDNYKFDIKY
ncbi:MAG: hypothetical protein IPL63_08055 [Saprospiraceae bacterium]|nr:hypothetical protein [Saprospiraceae bacterium]